LGAPAVDGVVFDGVTALAKAHRRSGVGFEGGVVVGDHQGVGAQCGVAGVTTVLEPVEQASAELIAITGKMLLFYKY